MKKAPIKQYAKKKGKHPITAMMAEESRLRFQQRLLHGCNGFEMKQPISNPMSFWTEQDILQYIKGNSLSIAPVYGDIISAAGAEQYYMNDSCKMNRLVTTGCNRTGCIFCGFGCHLEKEPSRFQRLKQTHPRQYAYCMDGGEYGEDGIWRPNKDGLGMRHVFEELNKIYGEDFIRYE